MMPDQCSPHATRTPAAGALHAWAIALRPRSLLIAVSPVLVGAALGYACRQSLDPLTTALVFGVALLMQALTNLQNDVGYALRGGDAGAPRFGLPHATSDGLLGVRQVRIAIAATALVATALGMVLVAQYGWPVLALGSASLLAALAYMGGPKPIAYTPFGEVTVFVFFGLVAVLGTQWLLGGTVTRAGVLAAAAMGSLAASVLTVNNHRDMAHDRLVGRITFAVRFGERASRALFGGLVLAPFTLLPAIALAGAGPWPLLALLVLPPALRLRRDFARCPGGAALNAILFRSFGMQLWFAGLLAAGLVASRACS
jgi:1,4-dihydroxy-2-naphthoate octaprenyltransferase